MAMQPDSKEGLRRQIRCLNQVNDDLSAKFLAIALENGEAITSRNYTELKNSELLEMVKQLTIMLQEK